MKNYTAYEIPVTVPVLKMLKRDHGYSKHMRIDQMLLCKVQGNVEVWKKYVDTTLVSQVRITVVCRYASYAKLYTLAKLLENDFKTKMMLYIEAAVESGLDASEAIRCFMEKYDISESDLKMETAYKRWQRYRDREYQKDFIPLW